MLNELEDHALSLPYFKCHRLVLELFIQADVSKVAQRVYLYLCHNSLVNHGVSHRLQVSEIANYFGKSERSIYRYLNELEDAGLGSLRHHGDVVFELPAIKLAQLDAKGFALRSDIRKDDEAFEADVESAILDIESTLARDLSARERQMFVTRRLQRKHAENVTDE